MMNGDEIRDYYSREVCAAIFECSRDREIGSVREDGKYASRPAAVNYPEDIQSIVRKGAVSFHGSIERWKQPMMLSTGLPKRELDEMRLGWDFVIDIDCDSGLKFASPAAEAFIDALEKHGIRDWSVKFSGNRGFHIGVPFEVFPKHIDFEPTAKKYPALPAKVAEYLKEYCREDIKKNIRKLVGDGPFDPYQYIDIDIGVFASRHLFRLPYCLHQKTWLASIPISRGELKDFDRESAKPENVEVKLRFLERRSSSDASRLIRKATYWAPEKEASEEREFEPIGEKIDSANFPPCIKNILNGIEDGKKRSVFVLTCFLLNLGWSAEDVKKVLLEWNKKNQDPLNENVLLYTLRDQKRRGKPLMCPNCDAENYYKAYGVCTPDKLCGNIKNPAGYALARRKEKRQGKKKGKSK
ncbi:MAG: DNA primase small subunit domain-containing protein [archaeon]